MQANDPRRLGPVVPVLQAVAAATGRPLGLVDAGAAAGLCSIPDHVTLDHVRAADPASARTPLPTSHPGAAGRDVDDGVRHERIRVHTAGAGPSVHLTVEVSGAVPAPRATPIRIGARIALDPNPIDLAVPGAFERLVEAVPPEATDRTALMREAAAATRAAPPVRIRGTLPGTSTARSTPCRTTSSRWC